MLRFIIDSLHKVLKYAYLKILLNTYFDLGKLELEQVTQIDLHIRSQKNLANDNVNSSVYKYKAIGV